MTTRDALLATRRFGLGSRPGELARVGKDARGYLLEQLTRPRAAILEDPELEPSHVTIVRALEAQRAQSDIRKAQRLATEQMQAAHSQPGPVPPPLPQLPEPPKTAPPPAVTPRREASVTPKSMPDAGDQARPGAIRREVYQSEATARFIHAVSTDAMLVERLVGFWSNHFCVSITKGQVRGTAGAFEREAIRPHVLGRFGDMLKAVEQHPAMLVYLDNHISMGPNSAVGQRQKKGLNENLAREILELHTVGVNGGYTQDDVTNLARIITGWTVGSLNEGPAAAGHFFFGPGRHEPGAWTVMKVRYEDKGRAGGEAVLADLARHPSTARHIAGKLAVHFAGDSPPPALVDRLARTFRDTGGDLAAVTRALVQSEEAWQAPARRMVPPYDWLVSVIRGIGWRPQGAEAMRLCAALGQPVWQVPSPKGWPDTDDAWAAPGAVRERLRIAERIVREVDRLIDPRAVADDLLGPGLGEHTRLAVARAQTREQGLELLIMSPEFQRR